MAPVADRKPEGYDPVGVPVGSFIFLPSLYLAGGYDSNITASGTNVKDDAVLTVRPAFELKSDWLRHFLSFDGYFQSGSYASYSDADYQNWSLGSRGRLDVTQDFELMGYARYAHLNELPGDDETNTGLTSPLPYDRTTAGVGFRKEFNRLWTTGTFDFRDRDYDNFLDGAPTDQSYRDGQTYQVSGRVGYDISPLTSWFVGGSYYWYDMQDVNYDAEEYDVVTGLKFEPSRLLRGEAYVGYRDWSTDNGYLNGASGVTYGADLNWFVSPLATVTFTALQEVLTSNYIYDGIMGSAVTSNEVGVRLDYELRRNIVLSGWFNYQNQDYEEYPRNDDTYFMGAELRYLINRYATATLNYSYTDFDTNFDNINGAEDYNRSVVTAGITLTY
ncbi:outer membrane beta-barrel protein [Ancylobacter sp. MQZ15Z-1]|uniref:Outer membrane beta-barrel protein n=2 Tax=Ancylobacter mangrovi TaxID=2972472 RepID=A0A9X2PCC1_9HYPH|nr:outer membrane beta-barrel protein [Ancylobacter mangrovi]MCS0496094.1 outer membrane beta-barrel protein [Ancylobacter mangrovi]